MNNYTWKIDEGNVFSMKAESKEAAEEILKKICLASQLGDVFEDWKYVGEEPA